MNAILGYSTNSNVSAMLPFIASARKWHPKKESKIVIFVSCEREDANALALIANEYDVDLIPATSQWSGRRSLLQKLGGRGALEWWKNFNRNNYKLFADARAIAQAAWLHPHFTRWFDYYRFIDLYPTLESVFLSDVTDVFFQGNVFSRLEATGLTVAVQPHAYNYTNVDSYWMRDAYGNEFLEEIQGKKAICIGTIGGDCMSVKQLCMRMWSEFMNAPYRGVEQAVFNKLYYSGVFDEVFEKTNMDSYVFTISDPNDCPGLRIDERGMSDGGEVAAVVHMYNRLPSNWHSAVERLIERNIKIGF